MTKIFKKIKLKNLLLIIFGCIVILGGAVATICILQSSKKQSNDNKLEQNKTDETNTLSGPTKVLTDLPIGVKAIIYLDPTDLSKTCNEKNSTIGGTGTKSGCMKWYAYKEEENSYTMILDHNTTALVAWNSNGDNTSMNEVKIALETDTSGWQGSPRLITGQEVADITGNTSWTPSGKYFYFDSNSKTQTSTSIGASKYYWLYDYTRGCTSYGCKVEDSSTYGYWASTSYSENNNYAWRVYRYGYLNYHDVSSDNRFGVRPVITISKSNF